MNSTMKRAVEAGARAGSPGAFEPENFVGVPYRQEVAERFARKIAEAVIRAALLSMAGHLSDVVHCHSDDRPRRDGIDWNDGYQDGCKGAALALRARIQQMAEAL